MTNETKTEDDQAAAEQYDFRELALSAVRLTDGMGVPLAQAYLTEGVVYAVLELAEQQRIANLIAYVAMLDGQYAHHAAGMPFDESTLQESLVRRERAQERIREGLGL